MIAASSLSERDARHLFHFIGQRKSHGPANFRRDEAVQLLYGDGYMTVPIGQNSQNCVLHMSEFYCM